MFRLDGARAPLELSVRRKPGYVTRQQAEDNIAGMVVFVRDLEWYRSEPADRKFRWFLEDSFATLLEPDRRVVDS